MAQIIRKWIQDSAINNEKIDKTDVYTITGLRVDSTNAVGRVGIGITDPLGAMHIQRQDTSAGLMLDLNDGSSGRNYQFYSANSGVMNIRDYGIGVDRFTLLSNSTIGRIGVSTTTPLDTAHLRVTNPGSSAALRLDLDDGLSGQAYRIASNPAGDFIIEDLDATATRLTFDSAGAMLVPGDATFSGNFEVDGTVIIINTEIFIADELEINQTDATRAALIASQDNAGATETVVKIENASTSNHALTVDRGNVGFSTTDPQAELHVEGDIVGKLTAAPSNIGSATRRVGTIYMASNIDYESNLDFSVGGVSKITLDTTNGRVGIGSTLPDEPLTVIGNIRGSATLTTGGAIRATTGSITAVAGAVDAATTVTGGTGVTATTGNIVASTGDIIAASGDMTASALNITTGTNVINGSIGFGTASPVTSHYNFYRAGGGGCTVAIQSGTGSPVLDLYRGTTQTGTFYAGSGAVIMGSVPNGKNTWINAGGVTAINIDGTNQNIGFGTVPATVSYYTFYRAGSPGTFVSIHSDDGAVDSANLSFYRGTTGTALISSTSDRLILQATPVGHDVEIRAGGAVAMTIDGTTQGVGIGTTIPAAKLHVEGSIHGANGNTTDIGNTASTTNGRISSIAMVGGSANGIQINDIASGLRFFDYSPSISHFRVKSKGVDVYNKYHVFTDSFSVTGTATQTYDFNIGDPNGGSWELIVAGYESVAIVSAGMFKFSGDMWLATALTTNTGSIGPILSGYFVINGLNYSWSTPSAGVVRLTLGLIMGGTHSFSGTATVKLGIPGTVKRQ